MCTAKYPRELNVRRLASVNTTRARVPSPMPIRLIALLVLSSVLAVFGQDQRKPATYYLGLEQEPIRGRTIGITDGDTIKVLSADKEQILVRIAFIDAPEKGQPFGERAKQALSKLVFDKEVELRPHTID